jgi:nicotinamidase-related amidase
MLLDVEASLLLVVDVQDCFLRHVVAGEHVTQVAAKLTAIARDLGVPVVVTEHNPERLGGTTAALLPLLPPGTAPIAKLDFACLAEPEIHAAITATGRRTLVLCGLESHICIAQTALAALAEGFSVFVAADGISARGQLDHELALERLARHGAEVTTWEAIAYEWVRRAGTPAFKKLLGHIKAGL